MFFVLNFIKLYQSYLSFYTEHHAALAPKYGLKGIPHLVLLDGEDATLITTDGRTCLIKDQYGLEFPWRPRTLLSLLPKPMKRFLSMKLQKVKVRLFNGLKGVLEGLAPKKIIHYISVIIAKIIDSIRNSSIQVDTGGGEVNI